MISPLGSSGPRASTSRAWNAASTGTSRVNALVIAAPALCEPDHIGRNYVLIELRPMSEPVKRRYDTTTRRERSARTRRRILDAARNRILDAGYRATTIRAIAADADVSVATIYELVGRKPDIARELVEPALSGTDQPIAGPNRDYATAMRAEPDAATKLALYAAAITDIQGRLAPLFAALRDAANTDSDAAEVWAQIAKRRATNMGHIAAELIATGQLRGDLDPEQVADTLWALNSPEIYLLLTTERGWTPDHFRHCLTDTWQHAVLTSVR